MDGGNREGVPFGQYKNHDTMKRRARTTLVPSSRRRGKASAAHNVVACTNLRERGRQAMKRPEVRETRVYETLHARQEEE